jgi:hypothetical protein
MSGKLPKEVDVKQARECVAETGSALAEGQLVEAETSGWEER